jgi:signal transduction histidine kinase/HAMP domain-containing protein
MNLRLHLRDLPLRSQLMLVFAALSIATTVISTITLTTLSSVRLNTRLHDKSVRYAQQLQRELAPIIAYDDHLSARELFESLMEDREIDGLAVYAADGALVEGIGARPDTLPSLDSPVGPDADHTIAVAGIKSREGRTGRLYVSLTSRWINETQRRDVLIATAAAAGVALLAILLAARISRLLARRLVGIAQATKRMAAGDFTDATLDEKGKDEIAGLSRAFNVMVSEVRRLAGEHEQQLVTERERLEKLVSDRTQALEQSREMFRLTAESTKAIPFALNVLDGAFLYIGTQSVNNTAIPEEKWKQPGALDVMVPRAGNPDIRRRFDECPPGPFEFEATLTRFNGQRLETRWSGTCEIAPDAKILRGLMQDVTEIYRLESELAAAQKLESVGRLAAGVAHEINTPVQFVSDNIHFVRTSATDMVPVIRAYRDLQRAVLDGGDAACAAQAAAAAEAAADVDYLIENVPPALDSAIDGLGRIATIVRSMKEFAHPDQAQMSFADLNQAIQSTLVVARNEYKYIAELETGFGVLPPVACYLGEINQVVLNLLVNAAHAIGDVVKGTSDLGRIAVSTRVDGDSVEISVSDTGAGIPEAIRDKIFDPFFTTKEVGKGTGQGLAIAHSVIVKKHGGTLRFESEIGKGTTFFIRLPVRAPTLTEKAA